MTEGPPASAKYAALRWFIRKRLLPEGTIRNGLYRRFRYVLAFFFREGLVSTAKKAWRYLKWNARPFSDEAAFHDLLYQAWIKENEPKEGAAEQIRQDDVSLRFRPRVSILMTVSVPDQSLLRAAIDSVRHQSYQNWQLCIAANLAAEPAICGILNGCAKDDRIEVANPEMHERTGGAFNAALALATGEFICTIGQYGQLAPWALLEVVSALNASQDTELVYSDEDELSDDGSRQRPFFKPGFSPDLLASMNYVGHLVVFRRGLIEETGAFRDGSQEAVEYDMVLRASELARKAVRIPKVLYHERDFPKEAAGVAATKRGFGLDQANVLKEALARRGEAGTVEQLTPNTFRVKYAVVGHPLVSIIVLAKNKARVTRRCIESIETRSTYRNFEIVLVDNGSTQLAAKRYLDSVRAKPNRIVLDFPGPFNYSRMNNFAAQHARGDFLLFLNNDTEVITPDWMEELIGHAQREKAGAVGVKLLYPDGRVQHGGVILGIGETAGHAFYGAKGNDPGYKRFASVVRNCSAVTAACMMMRRRVYEEAGGFDESFSVAFNDIDLCLRLGRAGYRVVYTPHAVLYHYEGETRGEYTPAEDTLRFKQRWDHLREEGDPFYSPNLALEAPGFEIKRLSLDIASRQ